MTTDQELDADLAAADPVNNRTIPALPISFIAQLRVHEGTHTGAADDPASIVAARQLADEARLAGGRRPRRRTRRLVLGGIAATASVAAAVVLIVLPGGTPSAYADYEDTPQALSITQTTQLARWCRDKITAAGELDALDTAAPVLAERRGSWAYVVLVSNTRVTTCLTRPDDTRADAPWAFGGGVTPGEPARPTTGVRLDSGIFTQAVPGEELSPDAFSAAVGQAAPDVTAVDVVLPDGQLIHATLTADGWWGAWWPGGLDSEGNGGATGLRYTTTTGEVIKAPYGEG